MWQLLSYFSGAFKLGLIVAYVAAAVALTLGLVTSLESLLAAVAVSLPTDVITFSSALLPTNIALCISTIISAKVARWVYDWNISFASKFVN